MRRGLSRFQMKLWDVFWAVGAWALRSERNRRLFSDPRKEMPRLISDMTLEIERWVRFA